MSTARVNRPMDPQQRDRDVERFLRLYGIYKAFTNGKLPTNRHIDIALTSLVEHEKLKNPNDKLSQEGRVILEDFRNAVDEAKRLLLIKNHDQALQEFIYNTTQLGIKGGPETTAPTAPVEKSTIERDRQQGLEGLRTLGELVITNGEFRKLLRDSTILLRDIIGDVATKTATKINPSEDELSQIDRPAPENEWHEAPSFSKENIKGQIRSQFDKNKPLSRKDVQEVAGNVTQATDPQNSRELRDVANGAAEEQRYGTGSGANVQRGVHAGVEDTRQRMSENLPEERKDQAREYRERTKNYLQSRIPQERRDQTIYRLKKMVVEIQGHSDYQKAIDTLLRLAEDYSGHGRALATDGSGTVKGAHKDAHLISAEENLKVLIERFANNTSADDLMDAVNDIYRDADRDPELRSWFRTVNRFLRTCLKEEGYIMRDESTREYNGLYDQGSFLLRDRYRDHTDRLVDEIKFFFEQFQNDADNQRFRKAMQKLFNDLGNDENGKPVFKKHLLKDVTGVIVPDLFASARYIPLPRIEYSDNKVDVVVENIIVESDNLMPNVFEVASDSYFRWGRKSVPNKRRQHVMISASQIQCDLRDVGFYIKRKQGFPSITDTGIADVFLGGDGFNFKLNLATADKQDRANFFKVESVDANISHMKIKLKKSNHKAVFTIFKPLLLKIMKPAMTKILEKQIRTTFSQLDALAWRIYQEEQRIDEEAKRNPDPEHVKNIYAKYYQAAQRELRIRREQLEHKTADKKLNVAIKKEDSIFRHISLPGGISTRATELDEQARSGDRWENELFTLGSAQPTTHVSNPPPVTRKSPFATKRALKERETASLGRESRDSGYLGDVNVGYRDGSAAAGGAGGMGGVEEKHRTASGFGERIAEEGVGGKPAGRLGDYTLNKPLGEGMDASATGTGRVGTAI